MKCNNCGTELPEGAEFCGNCGSRLRQQGTAEEKKQEDVFKTPGADALGQQKAVKRSKALEQRETVKQQALPERKKAAKKKTVKDDMYEKPKKSGFKKAILIAVLAVIVAAAGIFVMSRLSKTSDHDIYAVLDTENECIDVIYDTKAFTIPLKDAENYSYASIVDSNSDTAVVYVRGYDEEDNTVGCVYLVDGAGSFTQILDAPQISCALAVNSTALALIDEEHTLLLYDGKKNTKIADDVGTVMISPDGKTLVYTTIADADGNSEVVLYTEGKSQKIEEDMTVYSVSNKGKYIYAVGNSNSRLYMLNAKGNSEKLQSDVTVMGVNPDGTEIAFYNGSSVCVSVKGSEKKKLFSADYAYRLYAVNTYTYSLTPSGFAAHFYLDAAGNILYYVDKNFEIKKIASSVTKAYVTEDEKTVYYVKNGSIYVYKLSSEEDEKLIKDFYSYSGLFAVTPDGKAIYYVNEDKELCYYNGKETTVIEEDGDEVHSLYLHNDGTLFYLFDMNYNYNGDYSAGDLYYYQKGGKVKALASDVYDVRMGYNTLLYITYDGDEWEYFVSRSGIKFQSAFKVGEADEEDAASDDGGVAVTVSDSFEVSLAVETEKDTWTTDATTTLGKCENDVYRVTITNNSGKTVEGWALEIYVGADYDMDNFIGINKKFSILYDKISYVDYDFNVSLEGEYLVITPGNYSLSDDRLIKDASADGKFLSAIDTGTLTLTLIMDSISEDAEVIVLN